MVGRTMSKSKVDQLYLKNKKIFTTVYTPGHKENKNEVIIMCPPIYQERAWSERVCHNFFTFSSDKGYYCGCPHYYGVGDSEGRSEEMTIETMVDDVCALIQYFVTEKEIEKVNLFGFRFGAIIASLIPQHFDVEKIVFWSPVLNPEKYLYDMLKMCLSTQSTMFREIRMNRKQIIQALLNDESTMMENYALNNIYGYRFSKEFYLQVQQINLLKDINFKTEKMLILDINPGGNVTKELLSFKEKLDKEKKIYASLKGMKEKQFWVNEKHYKSVPIELFDVNLSWLDDKKIS